MNMYVHLENQTEWPSTSFGWKGHIIEHHLVDFLALKSLHLGWVYAEQCSESAHKNMKKTLQRYETNESYSGHQKMLEKAVVTYSSMRI